MKTIFCVPPVPSKKGQAQATQGRQSQYFKDPTYIYPIIPAIFISMLIGEPGQEFMWLDAIAEELNDKEFAQIIVNMKPDFIVMEANTMLFKRYCEIINGLKSSIPSIKIILAGEHVTSVPDTSSQADFVIKGGKWFYKAYKIITGKEWPISKVLPHINREVSRWWLYAYKNGNFKHLPATYTMASLDCWYRPKQPCTFCSWTSYHPNTLTRTVDDFLQEVEELINFGFKEFFDDSGTFPVGKWLQEFCQEMIDRGYNKYIKWGCNMRFGTLQPEDFALMAKAGCRFIVWGFESANQNTLDLLHKGYKRGDANRDLISAKLVGIWNHLTCMIGYPWETLEDEKNTFRTVKWILTNDWAQSVQASICMPYPGTRLYQQCKEDNLLLNEDWDSWDMTKPVVKLRYDFKEALKLQKAYYDISFHPKFIINKLSKIRSKDDIKFYWRTAKKVFNRFGSIFTNQGVSIDG